MNKNRRTRSFCQSFIAKINSFLILLLLQPGSVYSSQGNSSFTIDTTAATITNKDGSQISNGTIGNRTFHGPNNGTWSYSVAFFNLTYSVAIKVFSAGKTVSIRGEHALSVTVQGNFTIGTELDVSGQEVNFTSNDKPLFWLGGFVRVNKTCCTLGAGPGGAFSYHGGGHGGRGGGFYQDRNTSRLFGWSYYDTLYLLGGSTGTVLFSSKSGSGGGAIELIAENGILTVDAPIKADGFSSSNTSEEHCAGGTSGGLIRLRAKQVIIGNNGRLSAAGGDSGYSFNHSHYCGGGGGGGVIQVFSLTDNTDYVADSTNSTRPGVGIQDGEEGLEQVAVYFDRDMDLMINTSSCKMAWASVYEYPGTVEGRMFNTTTEKDLEIKEQFEVCKIEFTSSIFIGPKVRVKFSGHRAFSLISRHGNIEINSPLNISGLESSSVSTSMGGYVKTSADGKDAGPAHVSNCGSPDLYGHDFEALLGGSVCSLSDDNHQITVVGGGALELRARKGAIVIASTISVDGYSSNTSKAGAMGGTIRLDASKVILQRKGVLTARGCQASGGLIQIKSDEDMEGICDSKFDVTGNTLGLVNLLVSTANTFQVQYIQQGILEIDTTNARWMRKLSSNGSMIYSYYGELETRELTAPSLQYKVAKFDFQTPILINSSAEVKLSGLHSLFVSSDEGIYIGVDIKVGISKKDEDKVVGGYCVRGSPALEGHGPGRGRPGDNAGAGHGGKGGLLHEEGSTIYGRTYGIHPDIQLIGGSTGTTNCSSNHCTAENSRELVVACGGGAIEIHSKKNLTINAGILVNGITVSLSENTSSGGSSGGTIILSSLKHVILGDNAKLQARGADAAHNVSDSSPRGGGGGGVIAIFYKKGLVGNPPTAGVDTKGGNGTTSGDNGLVVLNGTRYYGFPSPVIEDEEIYIGCVINNSAMSPNFYEFDLKAHEAAPSICVEKCRAKYQYALIQRKTCNCINDNSTMQGVNASRCSVRCWSNSSLICGGENVFSAYRTGYIFSSSWSIMSGATPVLSAALPSKSSVVVMASSSSNTSVLVMASSSSTTSVAVMASYSVSLATEPTSKPATEPTEEWTTPSEEPTTRSPTEPSEKFKEIANATITEANVVDVVKQLKNLTSEETLNGGDTKVALEILHKITFNDSLLPKNKSERQKLGQNILEVASSLLSKENIDNWGVPTKEDNNTGMVTSQTQVLELVENIGLKIGEQLDNNASLVIESKNIAMGVETRVPDEAALGAEYPNYGELSPEWKGQDRVFVHKELFDEMATDKSSRTTVVYALYNQISELFPANTNNEESSKDLIVNSRILALKFNKQTSPPFKKPIRLWFDMLKTENVTKPSCSFVNFQNNEGTWSDTGCNIVDMNDPTVECACDHLTNFAILMQVKEFEIPVGHVKALTIITYVGCGISLFGLALTLATFLSLETLASERTSIHKNLVVAIGLAQIVFLAGIDAIYNPIACKAVALFLHYLYTAAFTWMLCEGIHLYSKVVEVFSEGSKMKYYYALGWGLPLTIVFISACSRWGGYGNERACWISIQDGLIWAFVAPVLIIMVINFVVMIMVIKVIIASVTSLQNSGNTSQVRAGVKGMIVLLPLLGLTWVFGIMAINKDTIAFQYLFAILNSLQGLFIFAFHCIGNTEVRVAYKRLHEKRTLAKSLPEHSLSTSHHSSREKRRMDSHETHLTGDDEIIVTKTIRSVSDVKICGDNMAMQTFGDTDSGRWSLNCPSPDPFDLDHAKRA